MQTLFSYFFFWWALLSLYFRIPVFRSNSPPALIPSSLTPTNVSLRGIGSCYGGKKVLAMEKRFYLFFTKTLDFLGWHLSSWISWHAPCKKLRRPPVYQYIFCCGNKCEDAGISIFSSRRLYFQSLMELLFTWSHVNLQQNNSKCEWVSVTLGTGLSWQDPFPTTKLITWSKHLCLKKNSRKSQKLYIWLVEVKSLQSIPPSWVIPGDLFSSSSVNINHLIWKPFCWIG